MLSQRILFLQIQIKQAMPFRQADGWPQRPPSLQDWSFPVLTALIWEGSSYGEGASHYHLLPPTRQAPTELKQQVLGERDRTQQVQQGLAPSEAAAIGSEDPDRDMLLPESSAPSGIHQKSIRFHQWKWQERRGWTIRLAAGPKGPGTFASAGLVAKTFPMCCVLSSLGTLREQNRVLLYLQALVYTESLLNASFIHLYLFWLYLHMSLLFSTQESKFLVSGAHFILCPCIPRMVPGTQ